MGLDFNQRLTFDLLLMGGNNTQTTSSSTMTTTLTNEERTDIVFSAKLGMRLIL